MKKLLAFLLILYANDMYAQLTVNGSATATQLVNTILGGGVTISNIVYTGTSAGKGTFTATNTNLGMTNGITLSSGNAVQTGPASVFASDNTNGGGDATLDNIVAPDPTFDAAVLEFDFSVASDSVQFRYVFGSEEYNDYVNTPFNDVFGFFISGPGIVGQKNIAVVPNTTTPVSINNVNNGGPYPGLSSGPCNNCTYFVDNINGTSIYLDAFTTVLTAKSAVQPCETYHIKLAIADVTDHIFNSAVFIEGGSFSSLGQINLFANGVAVANNDTVWGCPGSQVTLNLNPATNYTWSNGATTQSIVVNAPPINVFNQYSAYVTNPGFTCFAFTTTVYVGTMVPTAVITPNGSLNLCPGGNVTLAANTGNNYLWSNGATTQSINVINAGTYTVTVTNIGGCSAVSTPVTVTVGAATATITGPSALCNGAAANLQANIGQTYLWSTGATTQTISATTTGTYTVTVTQAGGCTATASTILSVNANPIPTISGPSSICQGSIAVLNAGGGYASYAWSNGATAQTINPIASATYTVTVTDANGCTGTASSLFTVNNNPTPTISGPAAICQGSSANLNAGAGYNGYLWSNGVTTQIQNFNLAGTYTVTVTDVNGCTGTSQFVLSVVSNPTPTITGTATVCAGNAATADAGVGFSSYLWSNGSTAQVISPTISGTYTVTVSIPGGCTGTASVVITVNANPSPTVAGTTPVCQGVGSLFNAGGGYNQYTWSNGASTQTVNLVLAGTYTVTVTDINGCTGTASNTLVVNANPAPAITGLTQFCQGGNTTLNPGAGYSSYNWSNGSTMQTLNTNVGTTYTVTVMDANGCTGTTSAIVTVYNLPSPTITGVSAICAGSSASLNGGAGYSAYLWSNGSTSQQINPAVAGIYTVTVTDANGCSNTANINVTVHSNPSPIVSGVNVICQGASTTFNAGAGYASYNWSNGNTAQTISINNSGFYTVTVTDANGCTGSATYTLTVNPNPVAIITGNTSFCQGGTEIIDAGAGFSSYTWSNGNTSQTISVSATSVFTVTVTNQFGCTSSTSVQVTVHSLPSPTIVGTASICAGNTSTLNAGIGYNQYTWSNGASSQQQTVATAGLYTVLVTDANGCTGTSSFTLTVNANPITTVTGDNIICQGQNTVFTATGGFTNYVWSNGANGGNININTSGTYTVTVTDANGCTGTASLSLVVNSLPQPTITGANSICAGTGSVFSVASPFASYLWSNGNTTQSINVNNAGLYTVTVSDNNGCSNSVSYTLIVNALPSPVIVGDADICAGTSSLLNAGNYSSYAWSNGSVSGSISVSTTSTYTVTVTDINGCTGTTSFSVVVHALPIPVISGPATICNGQTGVLTTGNFNAYSWSNGATTSSINTGTASVYSVMVTDANGCSGTSTPFSFSVLNAVANITASGPLHFCDGGSVVLTANNGTNYTWANGATSQSVTVSQSGTYTVTVVNNNGCTATSIPTLVTEHPFPVVKFVYDSTVICGALRVQVFNQSQAEPGSTLFWSFGDGGTATIAAPVHDYEKPGTYTIVLKITSPWGCVSTDSTTILVDYPDNPEALFMVNDDIATFLNPKIEFTDLSKNAIAWYWNFDDGEKSSNQHPTHFFKEAREHIITLTVTNVAGCVDSYRESIMITPLWIPNTFTPNSDGKNDLFFTSNYIANVQSFRMQIFNRWGGLVYNADSFTKPWNGNDTAGNPAPEGTYLYKLEITSIGGQDHEFTGRIDLLR